MRDPLGSIEKSFHERLALVRDLKGLDDLRVEFLGKKGQLTQVLKSIGDLPAAERPALGSRVNDLRQRLESSVETAESRLRQDEEKQTIEKQSVDTTLEGRKTPLGSLHPLRIVERKIVSIFRSLGFSVATGPEVETDFYNFEALNFPADHPARDMQDTIFLEKGLLLRTHTSPVQIRVMEAEAPPVQIVIPGRVYRHDSDITHSPVFHQVEGLCVGPSITFGHLKGALDSFVKMMFGPGVGTRFRPSFFPFTEPSAEMDMGYENPRTGKTEWMEVLGCGMVDPNVFEQVGKKWIERGEANPYDPEKVSGYAFGMGIERIAMVLYGIDDIRLFYENDVRFLSQFREL